MSNTEYNRTETLRLTGYEKHVLHKALMSELMAQTARVDDGPISQQRLQYIMTMRSLLERTADG